MGGCEVGRVLLDVASASPSVSSKWLHGVLRKMAAPVCMRNIIEAMYEDFAMTMEFRGEAVARVNLCVGIRLRCPLNGTLFALALDPSIRKRLRDLTFVSPLAFAFADASPTCSATFVCSFHSSCLASAVGPPRPTSPSSVGHAGSSPRPVASPRERAPQSRGSRGLGESRSGCGSLPRSRCQAGNGETSAAEVKFARELTRCRDFGGRREASIAPRPIRDELCRHGFVPRALRPAQGGILCGHHRFGGIVTAAPCMAFPSQVLAEFDMLGLRARMTVWWRTILRLAALVGGRQVRQRHAHQSRLAMMSEEAAKVWAVVAAPRPLDNPTQRSLYEAFRPSVESCPAAACFVLRRRATQWGSDCPEDSVEAVLCIDAIFWSVHAHRHGAKDAPTRLCTARPASQR